MPLRFSIRAPSPRGDFSARGAPGGVKHEIELTLDGGEIVFGRASEATIQLPFPKISARHARFFRVGGGYRVEDLGSANGTRLAGRRLAPRVPEGIVVGEVLEIGGVEVRWEGETAGAFEKDGGAGTTTLARRLVHDIFEACPPSECARVTVLSGPAAGRELVLSASGRVFKIGRGEGCDLVLPDEDASREHAALERDAEGIVVRDMASKNGIEVEGERVAGQRRLRDGEILRIGETRLRVLDPEDRYLRQIEAAEACRSSGEAVPGKAIGMGQADGVARGADASAAVPGKVADVDSSLARPSPLPAVAAAIAVTVLVLAAGVVLALVFAV